MKSIGNARRIDPLGRVVVPAELRKLLGIEPGDLLDISLRDDRIVVTKVEANCALCGRTEHLVELRGKHICRDCVAEIDAA